MENTSAYMMVTTPYVRPFNDDAIGVSAAFLLSMMVFGVIANLVTIIVIAKSKKLKSVFNLLILSLCASDLLSALVSPLFLYRRTWGFDDWLIPGFLCKVFWAVDTWTSYVTAQHILLFAIIRLISIKWPHAYKGLTYLRVKVLISVIWFVTFFCSVIPRWIWYEAKSRDRYSDSVDAKWPACTLNTEWLLQYRLYYKIAFSIFIYAPMVAILLLSPVIAFDLYKRRRERQTRKNMMTPTSRERMNKSDRKTQRKETHAILQLAFITGSFMFGYIPITAYTFYTTNTKTSTLELKYFDWNFGMIAYIFLRLSECLNPIFYNIASSKMRRETFALLKNLIKCCPCTRQRADRDRSASQSSNSESRSMQGTNHLEL